MIILSRHRGLSNQEDKIRAKEIELENQTRKPERFIRTCGFLWEIYHSSKFLTLYRIKSKL